MLPIAVSTGIGSENRAGIGIASVGGIIVAGILTLTVLPLVYTLTTGRSKRTPPTPPEPKREAFTSCTADNQSTQCS
jgi:predicted RND superfamily exporter protein